MIMVKINIGPIYVSEYTFQYVTELKNRMKYKNYSEVVNQMLGRYSDMLEQVQTLRVKIQELTKENSELRDLLKNYRDQIVTDDEIY